MNLLRGSAISLASLRGKSAFSISVIKLPFFKWRRRQSRMQISRRQTNTLPHNNCKMHLMKINPSGVSLRDPLLFSHAGRYVLSHQQPCASSLSFSLSRITAMAACILLDNSHKYVGPLVSPTFARAAKCCSLGLINLNYTGWDMK